MSAPKLVAAAVVVLLAAGGAVASTGGAPLVADTSDADASLPADAEAHATLDNGTVTVTAADGGEPLSNLTVEVESDDVERTVTTDENGTASVAVGDDAEELEVELVADGFEGELEYVVTDDGLRLVEESYEYEVEEDERDDEADDDAGDDDGDD